MSEFYLLTKPNCSLCDIALQRLQQAQPTTAIQLHLVDISQQPELAEEYGWPIPVLIRAHDDAELRWPFPESLEEFLNS